MATVKTTMNAQVDGKMDTIFSMFAGGLSDKSIADWSGCQERTIKNYRYKYHKLLRDQGIMPQKASKTAIVKKKVEVKVFNVKAASKSKNVIVGGEVCPLIKLTENNVSYATIVDGKIKVINKNVEEVEKMKDFRFA